MQPSIAVVLTARPSYAKLQPILAALIAQRTPCTLVACASALLERYGRVVDIVRADFPHLPILEVYSTLEGARGVTSAKDAGVLLAGLADCFSHLHPALVVVMADRYETLAASMAARYQNIPVAHIQGGERSGGVDDDVRDANTALASYHFPATELARFRLYGLGALESAAWNYGCPSIDLAKASLADPPVTIQEVGGSGPGLDLSLPFLTVLQHPDTNEPELAYRQMAATLQAVKATGIPALVLWPGNDAGMEGASKAIRLAHVHTVRTLPPRRFLRLLTQTVCLVGNSSAGIRESGYLGTPVVNIGGRQASRQRTGSVAECGTCSTDIQEAILAQVAHGPYPSSSLYGRGDAGVRIAAKLGDLAGATTRLSSL